MSLSDKKVKINEGISDYSFTWYEEKDVKEFIKRLKEELNVRGKTLVPVEIINKLAGKELVK